MRAHICTTCRALQLIVHCCSDPACAHPHCAPVVCIPLLSLRSAVCTPPLVCTLCRMPASSHHYAVVRTSPVCTPCHHPLGTASSCVHTAPIVTPAVCMLPLVCTLCGMPASVHRYALSCACAPSLVRTLCRMPASFHRYALSCTRLLSSVRSVVCTATDHVLFCRSCVRLSPRTALQISACPTSRFWPVRRPHFGLSDAQTLAAARRRHHRWHLQALTEILTMIDGENLIMTDCRIN